MRSTAADLDRRPVAHNWGKKSNEREESRERGKGEKKVRKRKKQGRERARKVYRKERGKEIGRHWCKTVIMSSVRIHYRIYPKNGTWIPDT